MIHTVPQGFRLDPIKTQIYTSKAKKGCLNLIKQPSLLSDILAKTKILIVAESTCFIFIKHCLIP